MAVSLFTKANTCATADSLSTSGGLAQATFNGTEHWFKVTSAKPITAFYGHWWQNQRAPKTIQVYSGTCSSLSLLYTQPFDTIADTINQFVHAFAAGTYYIKVLGFDGNKIGVALGIENIGDNCASPGCNLVPNFSFEDHPTLSAAIPWGAFTPWVNCWANASSNQGATPDYALDPGFTCVGNGNRCIAASNYQPWPNVPGQHATAHIFVSHVPNPNRREFILTNLQDNNGVTTLEANRTYYVSLRVRNNPNMGWYNDALGIMFTEQLWIDPNNAVYNPPPSIDRVYHSFTGANSNYNNTLWRQCSALIQNNATQKTNLVIGNFENNTTTAARMIAGNPNATRTAADLATIYIEHVEVLAMPDAGDDITVCAGDPVTLGWQPACLPAGVSYQWWDALYTTLLGTTQNLTVTALAGQTTYLLQVTYDGQSFFTDVTVTGLPAAHLNASITNQNYCNGDFTFAINDFDPANMTYSYTLSGLQATGHFDGNGNFTVGQLEFTGPLGMATVTLTATNTSSNCTKSQTFTVYDCCNAQPASIAVLNERFSAYNQGTAGMDYSIYGSVILDDNYTFTDCHFYLQPDAEMVALANLNIEFINCTFQACNEYKWDRIFNEYASTSITFTDCQIGEALRALHSENDAQLSLNGTLLYDNTLSQLARSYANGNALSWQSNTYNMYPLNSITQQHPQSTIPIGSILNLTGYSVVGIKFDEAQDFALSNGNTFWSDFTGFDNYLHVWLAQSSIGTIDGNTFNEGMNIYAHQNSNAIITNNYFQKSAQPNGGPGGIYAHGSTVRVGDEYATSTSNYLYDGASIRIEEPVQTEIYHNIISHNTLSEAIKVTAASAMSSRTRIQFNEITAKSCIVLQNLTSDWQSSSNQKLYVNFNDLFPTKSSNTTGNGNIAVGISANNCEGISIGENTITHVYTAGVTLPNATNNYQSAGIQLTNSRNAFVGCNDILYAGRGLSLSGNVKKDTWNTLANGHPVNFQSNEFTGNYHGIHIEIASQIPHIGEATLAADNRWLQAIGYNSGRRVQDDRVNISSSDVYDYYFSGAASFSTNPNYPEEQNLNYAHLIEKTANSNPQCSVAVPSNKRIESEENFTDQLIVHPNPSSDMVWITINSSTPTHQIAIYTITGQLIWRESNPDNQIAINVVAWPKGVYVVRANNAQKTDVQRFVVN